MQAIAQHILSRVHPDPAKGLEHQGNWPSQATYAVEYTLTHTYEGVQYPGPTRRAFFEDFTEYVEWIDIRRSWVNSAQGISMEIRLYEWDLDPTCKDYFTLE